MCPRQYRSQRAAYPLRTMAHEISPDFGDVQKAAVRFPPGPPADRQRIVGPSTVMWPVGRVPVRFPTRATSRSEEHTSELQSLMRISYAVFCLKKKKHRNNTNQNT